MKISEQTITSLAKIITGDIQKSPYKTGPQLIVLFNEIGFNDSYGQGFPTRYKYCEQRLREINGTTSIRKFIEKYFDDRTFMNTEFNIKEAITYINQYLQYDGYEIVKNGIFYTIINFDPKKISKEEIKAKDKDTVIDFESLKSEFYQLSLIEEHERGFKFQDYLYKLFDVYKFNPRPSFKIVGEQIDGSIEFEHEFYLIEAKWQKKAIIEADLSILNSRVTGHSGFGRGIFITMSAFSNEGIIAFDKYGPLKKIIGIDSQDIYMILDCKLPLNKVLNLKVRRLVEEGRVYYPVGELISELIK